MGHKLSGAILACLLVLCAACGGGGGGSNGGGGNGGGGGGTPAPGQVTGLTVKAGNGSVTLTWTAVSGATGYSVTRATISSGPYISIATPTATTYTDTTVAQNATYYYEVIATNSGGDGASSAAVSVLVPGAQDVTITVDAFADRHAISPLVYGVDFPPTAAYIQQTNTTFVRWGGNASTRYNWKNFYENSANDWYFQDNIFSALGLDNSQTGTGADSVTFAQDVVAAGADPIMTLPMMSWVAKGGPNYYSFSVAKYGAQCKTNPYLADDGNGVKADCVTDITGNDPNDANVPLLDQPGGNDPAGSVYRNQWVAALAPAFGAAPHFYDLDNEPDIWAGTHRDVHPLPVTYSELLNDFVLESGNLKTWDPKAVSFGPVSCCWEFYWNSAAGTSDKTAHGGLDFWPWWLNDVTWEGEVQGRSLIDVFDFHAYPEDNAPAKGAPAAQVDAEALPSPRGWWDTTWPDPNSWISENTVTNFQPSPRIEARLIRALAMVHSINPNLPVSITEWNFGLGNTGEDAIVNALDDAEGWGLLGKYNLFAGARWTAPDPSSETPSYEVLQLFRNYDGKDGAFAPISVLASNDSAGNVSDPDDCSTFAAVNAAGTQMTLLVVNSSPSATLNATLNLKNFTATNETSYSVSQAAPNAITAGAPGPFSATQSFPPYSVTLLVLTGSGAAVGADWRLNPGIVMVPANGQVTLSPEIVSGTGTITLSAFNGSGLTGNISAGTITPTQMGAITITAGSTPGFYPYTVTSSDGQTKDGIIEVGNPAATLKTAGDQQNGAPGAQLTLTVTVVPGQSGGLAAGEDILFMTNAGTLAQGSGNTLVGAPSSDNTKLIETTDANGNATVTLTLPATGTVTVTAAAPYPIGHPVATFTETVN